MATRIVPKAKTRPNRATAPQVVMNYRPVNKRNSNHPTHRLPFVVPAEMGLNFWAFPQPSCFAAGYELGKVSAQAFLKSMRETPASPLPGFEFQNVAISAIAAGGDLHINAGRHGIACGFFAEIGRWVSSAVEVFGSNLDKVSEPEFAQRMTRSANKSEAETDAQTAEIMSKAAQEGRA